MQEFKNIASVNIDGVYYPLEAGITAIGDLKFTLEEENRLEVKAGEYTDSCIIYKVEKEPAEYYLKKGDSSNWM